MANMAKQMEEMNNNMAGIQGKITAGVALAVAPLTARMDASSLRMDRLERKQDEMKESIGSHVERAVSERIGSTEERTGPVPGSPRGRAGSYAVAAAKPRSFHADKASIMRSDSSWYWDARKCLRFFPVVGDNEAQIRASLDSFVGEKLRIPTGDLCLSLIHI